MKNLFKTYIGVACLMVGISSCSDDFLKEKKDYNNMTTVDVYSDKGQATAVLAKLYKQCFETYNSPLCGQILSCGMIRIPVASRLNFRKK